jgi:hypothetical protein
MLLRNVGNPSPVDMANTPEDVYQHGCGSLNTPKILYYICVQLPDICHPGKGSTYMYLENLMFC